MASVLTDDDFGPERGYPDWLLRAHQRADFLWEVVKRYPGVVEGIIENDQLARTSPAALKEFAAREQWASGDANATNGFAAALYSLRAEWHLADDWCEALPLAILHCLHDEVPHLDRSELLIFTLLHDSKAVERDARVHLPSHYDFREAAERIRNRAADFDSYMDMVAEEVDRLRETLMSHVEVPADAPIRSRALHRYRPAFHEHVVWTARYQVGLESYGRIAKSEQKTERNVGQAVSLVRREIGLSQRSVIHSGGRPRNIPYPPRTIRLGDWHSDRDLAA
jgi:hypothetical protein